MLAREEDPRALHKIATACGAFRHASLRKALRDAWDTRAARLEVRTKGDNGFMGSGCFG
jgi:hypothetical protein